MNLFQAFQPQSANSLHVIPKRGWGTFTVSCKGGIREVLIVKSSNHDLWYIDNADIFHITFHTSERKDPVLLSSRSASSSGLPTLNTSFIKD